METKNCQILETYNLTKEYRRKDGSALKALSDINFEVNSGEFLTIIGRSGSGKTTLLNVLGALDRPTVGEVVFEGKKLQEYSIPCTVCDQVVSKLSKLVMRKDLAGGELSQDRECSKKCDENKRYPHNAMPYLLA